MSASKSITKYILFFFFIRVTNLNNYSLLFDFRIFVFLKIKKINYAPGLAQVCRVAFVFSVLVLVNANCDLIQPILSFRKNLWHCYTSNLRLLSQNLLRRDFDVYNL